jgi:hypothetical protein
MIININGFQVDVAEVPTTIPGLLFMPQMRNFHNNEDWSRFTKGRPVEVSHADYNLAHEVGAQYMTHGIMEIGVSRNGAGSFTNALLTAKPDNIPYLGVDLDDKSYLDNAEKRIHTIRSDSFNQLMVREKARSIGMDKISILFIDGWHSVNAVINDWLYSDLLADNGIVFFHDTNSHPGPTVFLHAIDPTQYRVEKHFEDLDDFGVSVAYKIAQQLSK